MTSIASRRRSRTFGAWAVVAGLVAVAFAIGAASMVVRLPAPFAVDVDTSTVASVNPGSYAWFLGVRPGQAVELLQSAGSDVSYSVDLGGGESVSISETYDIEGLDTLAAAAVLFVYALVALRVGLPGTSLALGLSTAAALGPLTPPLGYPIALLFAVIPPLTITAALAATITDRDSRPLVIFGLSATFTMLLVLVAATIAPDLGWPWDTLWKLPTIVVLLISFVSVVPQILSLAIGKGSGPQRMHAFMDSLFPIARRSRLAAAADERSSISTEIHNVVLPSLGQAIMEVDANDPGGRARLAEVAADLRRSMGERQTAVLRRAGLLAAVRSYAASLPAHMEVVVGGSEDGRCPSEVEYAAYRVAQLALANAVDHSGGDSVLIEISESAHEVRLTVADDGVGIDDDAEQRALERGHVGLADMHNLAAAVGAQLTISGRPDAGTEVRFWYRG